MQTAQAMIVQKGQGRRVRSSLLLVVALTLGLSVPLPAQACPAMLMGYASGTVATLTAYITNMSLQFSLGYIRFVDAWTRLANQTSNNEQNRTRGIAALSDRLDTHIDATAIAAQRIDIADQFIPSRVVCGIASSQLRVAATLPTYTGVRRDMATSNTSRSLNGPSSGAERGSLHAMSTVFKGRCDRYANTAVMQVPTGITCPGPTDSNMVDLDIQPWRSIFQPLNIDTPELKQAAADTVILLTEPAPPDPIRGPLLTREEGRNAAVMRMRDVTRMNVSRAVLEDIVAMRTTAALCTTGDNSRLARYVELITGQKVSGNTISGALRAIASAGDTQNSNVQTLAASLATQRMMLSELRDITDQWVTLMAVRLALQVEKTRAADVTIAARPVNN